MREVTKPRVILIDKKDNVATALEPLKRGTEVSVKVQDVSEKITLLSDIPLGHKFAMKKIKKNDSVIKYGEPIGRSTKVIARGEHVHVHNVGSIRRLRRP
ncbi:MAG: D-galactarate dehydratase [Desulfobacteraceae bacterium]|nr:MAG: D-galactarate dehydratase [Desulfobacteraceae bacterium]